MRTSDSQPSPAWIPLRSLAEPIVQFGRSVCRPVICVSDEFPNGAHGAGLWATLLCQHGSVLALDFIKTYLKSVLFTVFVKIKSTSSPFGTSLYEGVK